MRTRTKLLAATAFLLTPVLLVGCETGTGEDYGARLDTVGTEVEGLREDYGTF